MTSCINIVSVYEIQLFLKKKKCIKIQYVIYTLLS